MNNQPLLKIEKIKKAFLSPDGEMNLIIDVSYLQLKPGEQVAIYGSSGSGKTTFLNLIAGILKLDSGSIQLNSHELSLLKESERDRVRAENIGYIFQTFNLLQGYTALDNVLLGMMFSDRVNHEYASNLLEQVGLGDRLNYKPHQLSVGQQQRVALARAMANRPKVVLADEPTGNLDYRKAREAVKLIRDMCIVNNAALIFVSHDKDIISEFDSAVDFSSMNKAFLS